MKLSRPIHKLKSEAKKIKREKGISLNEALNELAQIEGYCSWSLLMKSTSDFHPKSKKEILDYLHPGDLMLGAARPGLGKTMFILELLIQAAENQRNAYFYSLEYTETDVMKRVKKITDNPDALKDYLLFDTSDDISSDYIISNLNSTVRKNDVIGIDYLQLLDQKRENRELQEQVRDLKIFAKKTGCIIMFISQLDRSFDESNRTIPELSDIRMPNPVDLSLFNKILFLSDGKKIFQKPDIFEID